MALDHPFLTGASLLEAVYEDLARAQPQRREAGGRPRAAPGGLAVPKPKLLASFKPGRSRC